MPDGETLYDRVDRAIQRGEVWRAKEILRGNIRVRGYDVDLYEQYGRLLLDIGEMSEAGKYLFLPVGVRRNMKKRPPCISNGTYRTRNTCTSRSQGPLV